MFCQKYRVRSKLGNAFKHFRINTSNNKYLWRHLGNFGNPSFIVRR